MAEIIKFPDRQNDPKKATSIDRGLFVLNKAQLDGRHMHRQIEAFQKPPYVSKIEETLVRIGYERDRRAMVDPSQHRSRMMLERELERQTVSILLNRAISDTSAILYPPIRSAFERDRKDHLIDTTREFALMTLARIAIVANNFTNEPVPDISWHIGVILRPSLRPRKVTVPDRYVESESQDTQGAVMRPPIPFHHPKPDGNIHRD